MSFSTSIVAHELRLRLIEHTFCWFGIQTMATQAVDRFVQKLSMLCSKSAGKIRVPILNQYSLANVRPITVLHEF